MKKIDLTGQTFGELKVVEEDKETTSKGVHWKCICKNGHISSRSSNSLRNNKYNIVCQQCRARGDLTGQTFGRLKVVCPTEDKEIKDGTRRKQYLCECSCGNPNLIPVLAENLLSGHTQSCGCYQKERNREANIKRNKYDLSGDYGIGYAVDSGLEFYFDLEDYDKIKDYCWSEYGTGYLITSINNSERKKLISMHQLLTDFKYSEVDHANRKKNDNRKANLRGVSHQQNMQNQTKRSDNKSDFIGVFWANRDKRWNANICYQGKTYSFVTSDKEKAILWRLQKEYELFGPDFAPQRHLFAQYNIPLSDADFAKIEFFNPVGKDVVGVKETKNHFLGFITFKHQFQSKYFSEKDDAIKWRLQKELELFGPEKAPQRHLFEKYQIKKEKENEKT